MAASSSETDARLVTSSDAQNSSQIAPEGTLGKARSCITCAQRKVRCDKKHPCSRCQQAGIPCTLPSTSHRPRWARNLATASQVSPGTLPTNSTAPDGALDGILGRLKSLEKLVKDLSCELEGARTTLASAASQSRLQSSQASSTPAENVSKAGKVILDDSDHVRYVSGGFWSRIDHELGSLKESHRGYAGDEAEDAIGGEQTEPGMSTSVAEANRTPLDRHAFLLKHSLSFTDHDASKLLPMASQVPFLLEIFTERVHFVINLPHMPSLRKCLQQRQTRRLEASAPAEEALLFSVYYSAIASMEDDEVNGSFNVSKDELLLRYRIGLEQALAKADFLNNPSDTLVQALVLFLALARRQDSPKFVWMMTGLVVRMAHYLGMHQDGSESKYISPFQVEMQRRIWRNLCVLDVRVTEDLGTDLAIRHGSYSTKAPSNINDVDIWPEMAYLPSERQGLTEVTLLRLCSETAVSLQEMMATGAATSIESHDRRMRQLEDKFEREYFIFANGSRHQAYLAAAGTMRVILGRLTLLAFPPVLYSSTNEDFPAEIRTKLLISAVDVAEHNHALNSDDSCKPWRWIYQTQQHWHAVIYILIEICRRPWSSTIERAWIALQSPWLVPFRAPIDKNLNIWTPVRRLMVRARNHRETEICRLKIDPEAAERIEDEDQRLIPAPSSSITFPAYFKPDVFRMRWRQLIQLETSNTKNAFNSLSSLSVGNETLERVDAPHSSQDYPNNMLGTSSLPHSIRDPSVAASNNRDVSDYSHLDAFLGTDMEAAFNDVMNVDDYFSFDWNSWFESARGIL